MAEGHTSLDRGDLIVFQLVIGELPYNATYCPGL